jgi:hypothetical protein
MSRRDYASRIISDLCTEMGLPALALDADGRLSLRFDDITVTLRHAEWPTELLTVLVDLGETPTAGAAGLAALLELNLAAWARGGMTIGLGADGRRVLGRNAIPVGRLDTGTLRATIEPMLIAARSIRPALADLRPGAPAPGAGAQHATRPDETTPPAGLGGLRV